MESMFLRLALSWFIARLREPSTWAGIGSVVASANIGLDAQSATQIAVAVGTGIAGVAAVLMREKGVTVTAEDPAAPLR